MDKVRIVKREELQNITGLSRSSIYAKIKNEEFPKAIKLGTRAVGWIESEVQAWLQERIALSR